MIKKFLRDVVVIVVGKQAEEIAELLENKKHVNEFIIAKKLDITINQTRNILYKLSDYGLVSSIRKKDKKKGWYTYFWRFEVSKALEFLKLEINKKLLQINSQIKSRETKQFYVCEKCNIEFNEENALLHDFTCPECGDVLTLKDNTKVLRDFKRNLEKLEKERELIKIELKNENEKNEKIRVGEINKLEKEKSKKRAKDREERKEAKRKAEKGKVPSKKKAKKKVVKKKAKKKVKNVPKNKLKKKIVNKKKSKKRI